MKSKTFSKKLILNKKTVADLTGKQMKEAIGGESGTVTICLTCGPNSCHPWPSGCLSDMGHYCICYKDVDTGFC